MTAKESSIRASVEDVLDGMAMQYVLYPQFIHSSIQVFGFKRYSIKVAACFARVLMIFVMDGLAIEDIEEDLQYFWITSLAETSCF
jgi:hypothetical protein